MMTEIHLTAMVAIAAVIQSKVDGYALGVPPLLLTYVFFALLVFIQTLIKILV